MSQANKYTWNAKDYGVNSQNQFQWATELLSKLKLDGNETVLDIGCGEGKITAAIAASLPKGSVVGVDSSEQMINLAKKAYPTEQHPNLRFMLMDAQELNFTEEFDVAFSNAALHWVLDQKSVLLGVKKCLKSGGRILFQMAGKGNAKAILDIFDELFLMPEWKPYFRDFTFPYAFLSPQEYRALLVEAGLMPVRVEQIPKDMTHNGAAGLMGWIRTTWLPYTQRLPENLQAKFIEEIAQRYLKRSPPDAQGIIHLDMVRLEVEAKKP
jgi:trans-aconitate 2-methyltransferase